MAQKSGILRVLAASAGDLQDCMEARPGIEPGCEDLQSAKNKFLKGPEGSLFGLYEEGLPKATFRIVPPKSRQFVARLHQNYTLKPITLNGRLACTGPDADVVEAASALRRQSRSAPSEDGESADDFDECEGT